MKKIRIGIIGTGFIVKSFLEAADQLEELELKGIYSRKKETGEAFINYRDSVYVFTDLNELADSPYIDAVYIASPTFCHGDHSILLMEHKKHILCEKPICSNKKEWENMKETAMRYQVILLEAMRPLFTPGYEVLKESLYKVGKIRKVNFNYCQYSSRYDDFKKGIIQNAFRPELSNGALMDIGVYCIEVLLGLFGRPNNISAYGRIIPNSIDGMGTMVAGYDDMIACLNYSKVTDSILPCEIQGENGTLYFDQISSPRNIRIVYRDGSLENIRCDMRSNDMVYELQAWINMINGMKQDNHHHISEMAIELMDEARRQMGIVYPADQL